MEPQEEMLESGQESSNTINQLRNLAMLYHARGRIREAQEIYRLVLELNNKKENNTGTGGAS